MNNAAMWLKGTTKKHLSPSVPHSSAFISQPSSTPTPLLFSAVVGRCIPSFVSTIVNEAGNIVTGQNDTVVDKFENAVNNTELEEGTNWLAYLLNLKEYGMKIYADVRASWWMILV